MEITFPNLQSINDSVSLAFNSQLFAAETVYEKFSYLSTSTSDAEVYPRLNMLMGLREWTGDRVVQSLSQTTFRIVNRTYEETIGLERTDIEDDKFGMLTPVAQQLALNAARLPDQLVASLLLTGHTTPCYDGQNFFDTAHPSYSASNNGVVTPITVANYATDGSGSPPWYLFSTKQIIRPVIFQRRRPFVVIPSFSMSDPQVFWNKEFRWGVDGRCNVGFGIWQLGFMSTQALTHDNVKAAITTMATYRRPDGSAMGISPDMLVTGTANWFVAKQLEVNEYQPTASGAPSLLPNQLKGLFTAVQNPYLN